MDKGEGSIISGFLICWLLNIAHLGSSLLILFRSDRYLEPVYVLIGAMGILQLVYVVPIYRLLRRRARLATARGVVIAASITALLNAAGWVAVRFR